MAGVFGFEPKHEGVKVPALPLGYTPIMVGSSGFEPLNPKEQIYSLPRLTVSLTAHVYAGTYFALDGGN